MTLLLENMVLSQNQIPYHMHFLRSVCYRSQSFLFLSLRRVFNQQRREAVARGEFLEQKRSYLLLCLLPFSLG